MPVSVVVTVMAAVSGAVSAAAFAGMGASAGAIPSAISSAGAISSPAAHDQFQVSGGELAQGLPIESQLAHGALDIHSEPSPCCWYAHPESALLAATWPRLGAG
jgi:hypothetical protein